MYFIREEKLTMRKFRSILIFEAKRFFCIRNSIIIGMLLFFSLLFIQIGIGEYKNLLNRKKIFQEIEKIKVSKYINYTQYGTYGFRMLFVPDPISVFFRDSCVIPDMTSYLDSGERLKIYLPLKGKNIFDLKKNGMTDFSGILIFFGSLLALLYGYETLGKDEYLKFISSLTKVKKVFNGLMLSRIFLLFLLFLGLIASALLLMVINGFPVPINIHLLYFFLMIFLNSLFYFVLGTVFSTVKSKMIGLTSVLSCWFILLFIFPTVTNSFISSKSDHITPVYKLESEKFKIFSDFEKKAIDNAITYRYGGKLTKEVKELVLSYWNNEFKKIQHLEEDMRNQMEKNIKLSQRISIFFPSTYYMSVNNEISSRGYDNLIDFYRYVQELKRKFVKFYIDKLYFENFSTVVPFLRGDENVFYAKSRLPDYFEWGILVTFLYIAALFGISYSRFKKSVYFQPRAEDVKSTNSSTIPGLKLKKGDFKVWSVEGDLFKCQLYNLFSGVKIKALKEDTILKVSIDDQHILPGSKKENFFYLCHPSEIPGDIKTRDFLSFIPGLMNISTKETSELTDALKEEIKTGKKISQLDKYELGKLMLYLLGIGKKKYDIFLIHDIARGMPAEFAIQLKDKMEELKETGALVLFLTIDDVYWSKGKKSKHYFYESPAWCNVVDSLKQ